MENTPFFTVITASYNPGDALLTTVRAVLEQSFSDYEMIIKDGGSSDSSLEGLPSDGRIRTVCEPDTGIYDAMNRATELARGKYIVFMNCGDVFYDKSVLSDIYDFITEKAGEAASEPSPSVIVYGDCVLDGAIKKQPKKMTDFYLYRSPLNHQTMFFGKGVFEKHGNYNTALKVRADHELTVRAYREGSAFLHIDRVICLYEGGGFSESDRNREQRRSDLEYIRKTHFTPKQRRAFDTQLFLGVTALRKKLASPSSPKWLRRFYRTVSNLFNSR